MVRECLLNTMEGYLPSNSTFINCEFKFNQGMEYFCAPPDQFGHTMHLTLHLKECEIVSAEYNLSGKWNCITCSVIIWPTISF